MMRCSRCLYPGKRVARPLLAAVVLVGVLHACQPHMPVGPAPSDRVGDLITEPLIRVRLARSVASVRIDGPGRVGLTAVNSRGVHSEATVFHTPLTIRRRPRDYVIHPPGEGGMRWAVTRIAITPESGRTVTVDGVPYPGRVVLHTPGATGHSEGRFDVVNYTAMEQYLPGVLQKELVSNWAPAAFEAQAIAARSYAIEQQTHRRSRHFDLESTVASQAYAGAHAHRRARRAVEKTRGQVLTYGGRVLPAYYSSTCGGVGQDAAIAFPHGRDILPLTGHTHGAWCDNSPKWRWVVHRDRATLVRRFTAWGASRGNAIADANGVVEISVSRRNAAGRPARFTVVDLAGRRYELDPESFRAACNYAGGGLPTLSGKLRIPSSHLTAGVEGDTVSFTGRGYGHGVGMCQWGAQAMAQQGYGYRSILEYYYPGALIDRAY